MRGRTLAELSTEFAAMMPGVGSTVSPPPSAAAAASAPPAGGGDGGGGGGGKGGGRGGSGGGGASAFQNVRSTGMGLPICVRLAELMGGELSLSDRTDGHGAQRHTRALSKCV